MNLIQRAKTALGFSSTSDGATNRLTGYDGAQSSYRRRQTAINLRSEDRVLRPIDRDKLVSNTRLLRRNAAIVAWAIRQHLNYVASFNFQCRVDPNKWGREVAQQVNARVEELMDWWSRPFNCDVTGRHSLQKLIRMAEACALSDGDCFLMKLSDGHIQLIEGDRVRSPTNLGDFSAAAFSDGAFDAASFYHGVHVTDSGRPVEYAICDRDPLTAGFTLRHVMPSQYIFHHGYFDRMDQLRGVSPLAAGLNNFTDIYEATEYALAKMKLSQLFFLKLKLAGDPEEAEAGEPYTFDFGGGPQAVNLSPEDDASILESNTPSSEFQAFMLQGIQAGLKSLDIPFSFYDESHTNYSGARQALLQYQQSVEDKRANLIDRVLTPMTVWRLGLFIADGHLQLPDGMTMDDLKFEWIGTSFPWIDPLKEVSANAMAMENLMTSPQRLAREQGLDWFTVLEEIAQAKDFAESKGIVWPSTSAAPVVNALVAQQQQEQHPQKSNGGKNGDNRKAA